MQLNQLISQIKSNFQIKGEWIKDSDGGNDYEFLIVPKGLMPAVDEEIRRYGFITIDKGNWVKDDNYLAIQIVK